jgi:NAD(P)-dependent dehydrogenase (short-subunit alcohol dehydrogenase family)
MTSRPADRKIAGRALVTGGAIRVGRAIALALADAGFDVAIAFHRSAAEARRTVEALRQRGANAIAIRADLRDARAARTVVAEAARALRGLDVLVNSAALFEKTPLASTTRARWDEVMSLNLRAAFFCTQAASARMTGGGHVVNVSDVITRAPRPGWAAYTASKAGLEALTRTLALELRDQQIAVNCVAPGAVLKPDGLPPARWRAITRDHAATAADVAAAVVFFATCPAHITGQILAVDAGTGA